jgi:hypothetical protein
VIRPAVAAGMEFPGAFPTYANKWGVFRQPHMLLTNLWTDRGHLRTACGLSGEKFRRTTSRPHQDLASAALSPVADDNPTAVDLRVRSLSTVSTVAMTMMEDIYG